MARITPQEPLHLFGDPNEDLLEIAQSDDVIFDIKYATQDNFTGKQIYAAPFTYIHKDIALPFLNAVKYAADMGYQVRLFDAWRPHEAQVALWNVVSNPMYISNPYTGGCTHCRGTAVDLTLVDKNTGKDLDMGTEFDSFEEKAHHNTQSITHEQRNNRIILAGIMSVAGFTSFENEWWHYQASDWRQYPKYRGRDFNSKFPILSGEILNSIES